MIYSDPNDPEIRPEIRKVLIITSSGGGGLLQAANAKEQEIKANYPHATVIKRDVMKDWIWKAFGRFCVNRWNEAQHRGDVKEQTFLGATAAFAEYLFWLHIFCYALYTMFTEDVDRIIDTQVMGTAAIIKALRVFNYRRRKQIVLEKILVDLPTKRATHFFRPIRTLSEKDRRCICLITIAPMLEEGQTEEEFWEENCKLTKTQLRYEDYYVRQSFVKYRNLARNPEPMDLKIRYQSRDEMQLIQQTAERGAGVRSAGDGECHFTVQSTDRVCTVLLGSQPSQEATLNYVRRFIEMALALGNNGRPTYLFVFCSNHEPGKNTLLRRAADVVKQAPDYPQLLTVIPMSFQNDDVIAALFFRSDITCTRSGGQTAMELLSVSKAEIWVHSEAKNYKGPMTDKELLEGIPCWESANAVYLQKMRGARIVTPGTFIPFATEILTI